MLTTEEILIFIQKNAIIFKQQYKLSKIGLIGSFARGEQNETSDIDLLIEFEAGTKNIHEKKKNIKTMFFNEFHRDVDLCREKYLKPFLKEYITRDIIYA